VLFGEVVRGDSSSSWGCVDQSMALLDVTLLLRRKDVSSFLYPK
jgi:hypothetical protein